MLRIYLGLGLQTCLTGGPMKIPIRVARINKESLDKLLDAGYVVIICGWGKYDKRR
jgi:hypothetical protein